MRPTHAADEDGDGGEAQRQKCRRLRGREPGGRKLELRIDRQAKRVVGHDDHRAVFTKCSQPGQDHPGANARPRDAQIDKPESGQRPVAKGRSQAVERRIDDLEGRPRRDHHKGGRDERLGDHDAGQRISEMAAEMPSQKAVRANQVDQQNAAHNGRQGQRQLHGHAGDGAEAAPTSGQHMTQRHTEKSADDQGNGRRLGGDHERRPQPGYTETTVTRRGEAIQESDDRDGQIQDQQASQDLQGSSRQHRTIGPSASDERIDPGQGRVLAGH